MWRKNSVHTVGQIFQLPFAAQYETQLIISPLSKPRVSSRGKTSLSSRSRSHSLKKMKRDRYLQIDISLISIRLQRACVHWPDNMFPSCCDEEAVLCPDNVYILPRLAAQLNLRSKKKKKNHKPNCVLIITEFNTKHWKNWNRYRVYEYNE